MLETNTFRLTLLAGIIGILGLILTLVFVVPFIPIKADSVHTFELIMGKDIGADTKVTIYDAAWYAIKGWLRGDISHY